METGFVSVHVFDRLMEYDKSGKLVPGLLAKEPEVSADGRVYRFELKKSIRFSDGSPLTVKDVRFTMERALKPEQEGWIAWIFNSIEGADAVSDGSAQTLSGFVETDGLHFEVRLSQPYAPFVQGLASPYAGIMPAETCTKLGKTWGAQIIGTGPYGVSEWEPGKRLVLTKNPLFWGNPVQTDQLVTLFGDDYFQNLAGFREGALDVIPVPAEQYDSVRSDGGLESAFKVVPALNIHYLNINSKHPILKDVRVRKAISLAIDRDNLCAKILKGAAIPAFTFLPPGIPGYDPDARIPYDPAQSRKLLAEAGYPDGIDLDYPCIHVLESDYALKSMLEQVGVRLKLRTITAEERKAINRAGQDTVVLKYWWADIPDGDNFLYNIFNSRISPRSGYVNPEFDRLSELNRREPDAAKRMAAYRRLDAMICRTDWQAVPLYHQSEAMLVGAGVSGVYINPVTSIPVFREAIGRER